MSINDLKADLNAVWKLQRQIPEVLKVDNILDVTDDYDVIKIVLDGEGGTGKSTFVIQMLSGIFKGKYECTCGASAYLLTFRYENAVGVPVGVNVHIVDTTGQEGPGELRNPHYEGADGLVCLYDLGSCWTLKELPKRVLDFKRNVPEDKPIIFLGNFLDKTESRKLEISSKVMGRVMKSMKKKKIDIESIICKQGSMLTDDVVKIQAPLHDIVSKIKGETLHNFKYVGGKALVSKNGNIKEVEEFFQKLYRAVAN